MLALGWRGEVGAKPFLKIFQVPLTKGTKGFKVGQRSLPVARDNQALLYQGQSDVMLAVRTSIPRCSEASTRILECPWACF